MSDKKKSGQKWSADVTAHDHPFDLEPGLFASGSAQQIAAALKKSAQDPARHSDDPYRSAISMLDFYVNRAGANLSADQRAKLDQVKSLLTVLRPLGACKLLIEGDGPLERGPLFEPAHVGDEFGPLGQNAEHHSPA